MNPNPPITEADLHSFVDGQLTAERKREVEAWLALRPDEAQRVVSYQEQKLELRSIYAPVLHEPVPQRPLQVATCPRRPWYLERLAAGVAIAVASGAAGWGLGSMQAPGSAGRLAGIGTGEISLTSASGFAQRALVAHTVYSTDVRRPVEVDAAHEDQLVAWLSKRMGAPMKPPRLQALGYALKGGRLLPGARGPVAQFMYRDAAGAKLTLYVSSEIGESGAAPVSKGMAPVADTAFRFAQEGPVNVFYWVDAPFGYAISAGAGRDELARVSGEVYRQLSTR